uniref:Uncharacterized protein n=1 Tax=Oryza barthii TaxID=65489 RepID=A0A0D3FGY4_9ORYZ
MHLAWDIHVKDLPPHPPRAWSREEHGAQTGKRDGAALWRRREKGGEALVAPATPLTRASAGWPPTPSQLIEHVDGSHRPLPPRSSATSALRRASLGVIHHRLPRGVAAEAHLRVIRRQHPLPSPPRSLPVGKGARVPPVGGGEEGNRGRQRWKEE